ncbi:hypothetical protein O9992_15985 [Vibrio lentus]|nr:hypothetical protein [Vibrio lentus]
MKRSLKLSTLVVGITITLDVTLSYKLLCLNSCRRLSNNHSFISPSAYLP